MKFLPYILVAALGAAISWGLTSHNNKDVEANLRSQLDKEYELKGEAAEANISAAMARGDSLETVISVLEGRDRNIATSINKILVNTSKIRSHYESVSVDSLVIILENKAHGKR